MKRDKCNHPNLGAAYAEAIITKSQTIVLLECPKCKKRVKQ